MILSRAPNWINWLWEGWLIVAERLPASFGFEKHHCLDQILVPSGVQTGKSRPPWKNSSSTMVTFEWNSDALSICTWCKVCLPGHKVIERQVIEPSSIEDQELTRHRHAYFHSVDETDWGNAKADWAQRPNKTCLNMWSQISSSCYLTTQARLEIN